MKRRRRPRRASGVQSGKMAVAPNHTEMNVNHADMPTIGLSMVDFARRALACGWKPQVIDVFLKPINWCGERFRQPVAMGGEGTGYERAWVYVND